MVVRMDMSIKSLGVVLEKCIRDAQEAFDAKNEELGGLRVMMWPQVWSDERCGFWKTVEGEEIEEGYVTEAQTIIVFTKVWEGAALWRVYHGGRFAYEVKNPTKAFIRYVHRMCVPGEIERENYFARGGEPWEVWSA